MDKEEFHAVIKLVSVEEIFAKVCPCEEEDKTILILGIALAAFFDSIILAILITSIVAWYIKYYNRNRTGE